MRDLKHKLVKAGYTLAALLLGFSVAAIGIYAQGTGTPSTLRVNVDANGYLLTAAAAQTAPITSTVFTNARLATDASGNLQVTVTGSPSLTSWSTTAANTATRDGIGVTSTAAITAINTTDAALGAQQWSPYIAWQGEGWSTSNSDSRTVLAKIEMQAVQGSTNPTGNFVISGSVNGGADTAFQTCSINSLSCTFAGALVGSANIIVASASPLQFGSARTRLLSSADGLLAIDNSGQTVGIQLNVGTAAPTVSSCGTGTITSGSRNVAGQFTVTGATACTVTFGAPNWTNAPFCVATNKTTGVLPVLVTTTTASAVTFTNLTDGDLVNYVCIGRI